MAKFNVPNYKAADGFGMPLNIRRGNPDPLDSSEVWSSLEAAKDYAKSSDVAYVGQKIAVVDKDARKVTHYSIENEAGDLKELGSGGVLIVTYTGDLAAGTAKASLNALEIHNYVKKGGCVLLETMPGIAYASYNGSFGYEGSSATEEDDLIIAVFTSCTKSYCTDRFVVTSKGTLLRFEEEYVGRVDAVNGGTIFGDYENNKAGELAVSFGERSEALGFSALAGGAKKEASGDYEVDENGDEIIPDESWRYNEAHGTGSMALGMGAVAYSRASKSLGYRTQTGYPVDETAAGTRVEAKKYGYQPENNGQAAVAIGSDTVALGNNSFAGGYKSVASGKMSFAFGANTTAASGTYAIAMGDGVTASATSAVAIGKKSNASAQSAVAIGTQAEASKTDAFALGTNSRASGQYAISIGHNALSQGPNTIAIGLEAVTSSVAEGQIVFGKYNKALTDALFIVGNGTDAGTGRSNAIEVYDTKAVFNLDVYAKDNKLLATQEYVNNAVANISGNVTAEGYITREEFDAFVANINAALAQVSAAQTNTAED